MARVPLSFTGWTYDDETKRIVASFTEMAPVEDTDPANFVPSLSFEVEFLPRTVDNEDIEQPEQVQIEQLNNVVDQLVVDMLMGGL
jgi:hypothetical protein